MNAQEFNEALDAVIAKLNGLRDLAESFSLSSDDAGDGYWRRVPQAVYGFEQWLSQQPKPDPEPLGVPEPPKEIQEERKPSPSKAIKAVVLPNPKKNPLLPKRLGKIKPKSKGEEVIEELTRIPDEVIDRGQAAVALYVQIINAGETERWAKMCALQQPPGTKNTDRAFIQGQHRKMEDMNPRVRREMIANAEAAGVKTGGKFYMSGLGRYDNPAAWVSCAEDVVTSCKVQNLGVEGVVNYKAPRVIEKPPPDVPLAEHLIQEMSVKEIARDPKLAEKIKKNPKEQMALREKVVAKYGRKKR